jgi:hypothetical protein
LFLCTGYQCTVSTTDIEKPRGARSGFALFTADLQVAVEMAGDFFVDSFEVKVVSRVLVALIHLPDTFGSVNNIEKDMSAAGTTGDTILAELKEEFGIIQATGPAALAAHGG